MPAPDPQETEVVEVVETSDTSGQVRTAPANVLSGIPGSRDDVLLGLQNLPGVTRAPLGLGALVLRGMPPEQSAYRIFGLRVPSLLHFAGLSSVLPGGFIGEVAVFPSNAPVNYGDGLGGQVDLQLAPAPTSSTGRVHFDVLQTGAEGHVRLGPNDVLSAGIRRSWVDAVLTPLWASDGGVIRAPRYYDGQVRWRRDAPGGGTVDALFMISDDGYTLLGAEGTGALASAYQRTFGAGLVRWRHRLGDDWIHQLAAAVVPLYETADLRGGDVASQWRVRGELRDDYAWNAGGDLQVDLGWQAEAEWVDQAFDVRGFGPAEEGSGTALQGAGYAMVHAWTGPVTLQAGARGAASHVVGHDTLWTIDPRVLVEVRLSDVVRLSASSGRASSFPGVRARNTDADGVEGLVPGWVWQNQLGLRVRPGYGLQVELTGYVNPMGNLLVGRQERFRFFQTFPPVGELDTGPYASEGTGLSAGGELWVRYEDDLWTAWLSVTGGRSLRTTRLDEDVPFDLEQPFALSAWAARALPRGWRLGMRVRAGMGLPMTPVVGRYQQLESRQFVPVFGDRNSERLPWSYGLDLRIDKRWVWSRTELLLYLDVQNLTWAQPLEWPLYNLDYSEIIGIRGLPLLPVLGIEGVFR